MRCPECGWPNALRTNEQCWRASLEQPCRREDQPETVEPTPRDPSEPVGWRKTNHNHLFGKRPRKPL